MPKEFAFITVHPQFIENYFAFGVCRSAMEKKIVNLRAVNLRDFAIDKRGTIDDHPYGGGDSMVMRPEPLRDALKQLPENAHVILTTPAGKIWSQEDAQRLALFDRPITFICGRFAGLDQRFVDLYVDEELSMGNFVVSGGELPALMMADATLRQIPGVLGNRASAENDSFMPSMDGGLEYPLYTRPEIFEGQPVPPVLLQGNHAHIEAWRKEQAKARTRKKM
jgi:tRNA (guanine37-N1)-methyltransferase